MNENQVRAALRTQAGVRVGLHMARYVSGHRAAGSTGHLSLLAQDARTGVPVQTSVVPSSLFAAPGSTE